MFSLGLPALSHQGILYINFNNFVYFGRFWKKLSVPPIHYGVFNLFGPMTKQTEFALLRSLPPPLMHLHFKLF